MGTLGRKALKLRPGEADLILRISSRVLFLASLEGFPWLVFPEQPNCWFRVLPRSSCLLSKVSSLSLWHLMVLEKG